LLSNRLWRDLGLGGLELQINTLGTPDEREQYRGMLTAYLEAHYQGLDEDSRRRLNTNPLRVLDSKNEAMTGIIAGAPALIDCLGDASRGHFDRVCDGLQQAGVDYTLNPRLVRGLDYYSRTVFEWVTDRLGSQGTVCAGGRYDGLVEQLGGRATPAVGFALGMERLVEMLGDSELSSRVGGIDAYMVLVGEAAERRGIALAEQLRDRAPGLSLSMNCGGGSFKTQFKRADRSGARYAIVLGEDELQRGVVGIKPLRSGGEQAEVPFEELPAFLADTRSAAASR
jgi:histidyl-tRNA synthetase